MAGSLAKDKNAEIVDDAARLESKIEETRKELASSRKRSQDGE